MATERRRREADRDTWLTGTIRSLQHPLRALAMAAATFCLVADVAMATGIVAAVMCTVIGVVAGDLLARTRLRLSWVLGGFAVIAALGLLLGAIVVRAEWIVGVFGTTFALHAVAFLRYGVVALFAAGAMRATAKRHPSWIALELAVIVLAVAAALAAHRGGVIARPLWLSDFAWRRGLDPADVLLGIGVGAALLSVSLLLFERKGRLSLAALPLIPLVAMLAVSCFEATREPPELGETSPPEDDEEGEEPIQDPDDGQGPGGGGSDDAGPPHDGGASPRPIDAGVGDGGASGGRSGRDGGVGDGGEGGGGLDGGGGGGGGGGRDGGGGGGGGGGGERDGGSGGGSGGGDGGGSGGRGDAASSDGGGSNGSGDGGRDPWHGWDAGLDDSELPPPDQGGDGEGGSGGPVDPQDLADQPPPTGGSSAAPVAVVLFERDYSPPAEAYYFRQEAWSELDGPRLVPSTLPEADRDLAERFPTERVEIDDPPGPVGRTEVVATVALLVTHPLPFALESPVWFAEARNPNPNRFRRAYRFLSRSQSISYPELRGRAAGNPAWSDEVRALYLEQHPDTRFADFANETIAAMPAARQSDPFSRAVAIKLRMDAMLTYSTRERHADAADPAVDFFFGNRIGYCVHFAHTAVYLFRAAGVPARVGVGYMSAEANRRGGSALIIQSGDAHAWPEIYLEGVGWIILDIAAARNLDPPRPPQDEELQQMLGEMAREQPPEPEDEVKPQARSRFPFQRAFSWLFAVVFALVLIVLYAIKIWRRIAPGFASARTLPRVAYRAALDRLAEVGIAREHGETREQFAVRVEATSPAFLRATSMLLAARLRAPGPAAGRDEHDRAKWREATMAMQRELRSSTKWWRRLLGLAHPLAFLDAR